MPTKYPTTTTSDQLNAAIRDLAATGMSYNNIAKQLRVTKNTVCGRARRLDLPQRGSPIKPKSGEQPKPARAPSRPVTPKSTLAPIQPYNRMETPFSAKVVVPMERLVKVPVIARSPTQCCWPIGFPKEPGFRFCSDPADFGRSYCGKHHAIAYVRRAA